MPGERVEGKSHTLGERQRRWVFPLQAGTGERPAGEVVHVAESRRLRRGVRVREEVVNRVSELLGPVERFVRRRRIAAPGAAQRAHVGIAHHAHACRPEHEMVVREEVVVYWCF